MMSSVTSIDRQSSTISGIAQRVRGFWGRDELKVPGVNLLIHIVVQIVALQFMPLPYYSRLSLHDGNTYYRIAHNLWSQRPITLLSWHKRILLPLLGRFMIPWNPELSFLLVGIVAASLSAVYFYKIAKHYGNYPLRLTVLYSVLPWLLFAAHHSLNEPMLMLFLLAGYYYYLIERDLACTVSIALALVSKELAALPALAIGILYIRQRGWRRALLFGAALIPFTGFCLAYGVRWNDLCWCLKETPAIDIEDQFSWKTGLWWMYQAILNGTGSSANPTVALAYDVLNQVLNLVVVASAGLGVYLLSKTNKQLAFFNAMCVIPLWFLGRNQYMLNSSLGRQFLMGSLVILAYDRWMGLPNRVLRVAYWLAIAGMLALGILWTLLYAKFFVFYKFF